MSIVLPSVPVTGRFRRRGKQAEQSLTRGGRRPASLTATTLGQVGKRFSEVPRTAAEIEAFADAMADMFRAYLERLAAE